MNAQATAALPQLDLSVLAPAHDEAANILPLVDELVAVLEPLALAYEIVLVDDGSGDDTAQCLQRVAARHRCVRALQMTAAHPGQGLGQSAALHAAIAASHGRWIAMLDADLQNDPADLPALLQRLQTEPLDLVQGDRSANRRDTLLRRISSWVGRAARRVLLDDSIRDTGCSLRVMRREVAESLPLQFRGMHRFIPLMARQQGFRVAESPVRHRARVAGHSKYGVWNRALPGLIDCLAVSWMHRRRRTTSSRPLPPA